MTRTRPFLLALVLCLVPARAAAQDANAPRQVGPRTFGGPNPGVDREKMWWAPTAEDWKKPVLITFQRTWEDALAVSRETQKAILVCVNMDGEIASEHYAGVRYRQAEIAALYEPYVCVIASVYRHNPRDFDEKGERILCPRFGSVTCGEHIWIEPPLYEQFMDGKRIAPRHIMVELDGAMTYDVYYAWDTDSVFGTISDGIAQREITPRTIVRGDRPIVERVASHDVQDRTAVEDAYLAGDRELKRSLLEAAREHPEAAPTGLLRLGVFGLDAELAQLARAALARSSSEGAVDVIAEALRVPLEEGEREALIGALARIGESSPKARTLAVVHRGLASRSRDVDIDGWSSALQAGGASYAPATERTLLESRVDHRAEEAATRAGDAEARLALAEASLALAVDPKTAQILASDRKTASDYSRLMFEDARRAALEAERLGASGWRVDAAIALADYYLGNVEQAYARATTAAVAIPSGAKEWSAIATLALFAEGRSRAITQAVREKREWPGEWLTDVNAAYSVLARHPSGTDAHVAAHVDCLRGLGAQGQAARALEAGLERFPDSWTLHERLRARVLEEKGVGGLEPTYAARLAGPDAPQNLEWFAGYAALVAAEYHRRARDPAQALDAYERAIAHYERAIERSPASRDSADHYVALAFAGRARVHAESADVEQAVLELVGSFERKPEAAATLDGLNLSPSDTSRMLLARCAELERPDLVATLEAARAKLDPKLLELPAYERSLPDDRPGRGRGRGPEGGNRPR